ncbi:hypothetical protein ACFFX0_26245 [Citricoccus parietis]|uniref:Uncharacterized protein n=1 Tax=Citricoccus parietis TaxID=592307 RepID=A0ABV5G6E7_9MICC
MDDGRVEVADGLRGGPGGAIGVQGGVAEAVGADFHGWCSSLLSEVVVSGRNGRPDQWKAGAGAAASNAWSTGAVWDPLKISVPG